MNKLNKFLFIDLMSIVVGPTLFFNWRLDKDVKKELKKLEN